MRDEISPQEQDKVTTSQPIKRKRFAKPFTMVVTVLAVVMALATSAAADVIETGKVIPTDVAAMAGFGDQIAVSGDTVIVGSDHNGAGSAHGTAYVYTLSDDGIGLTQAQQLTGPRTTAFDSFGGNVAIDGDIAAVLDASTDVRAVYVYERAGGAFTQSQVLTSPYGGPIRNGLAVDGDRIFVTVATFTGDTVAVFERSAGGTYVFVDELAPGGVPQEFFGNQIATDDDLVVVSHHRSATSEWVVHVYEETNTGAYDEISVLEPTLGSGFFFGASIAVAGDTVVVGSHSDQTIAPDGTRDNATGAAYVFERSGNAFIESQRLLGSDTEDFDFVGGAVDIIGDRIVIGAASDDEPHSRSGAAFIFDRTGGAFVETSKLTPSDPVEGGNFGLGTALGHDFVVIGAPGDSERANFAGAAYLFQPAPVAECNGLAVTVDLALGQLPTNGNDVIRGTAGADIIDGLGGDDVICGLQGNDTIDGGDGFDKVFAGQGNDTINGGVGNDRLVGGPGNDIISGGNGNDRIQGGPGSDQLFGQNGTDRIAGNDGNDMLSGGGADDRLFGNLGRDMLFGNDGDDVLRGGAWLDEMDGGAGTNDGCTLTDPAGLVELRVRCEGGVFGR